MTRHKLYFTDDRGSFNGYARIALCIDLTNGLLHVGNNLKIPLQDIIGVELRPLPAAPNKRYLAIDFATASVENGATTTLKLIHKDFLTRTKIAPMQSVVDELSPLIGQNALGNVLRIPDLSAQGVMEANYVFNLSVLIANKRILWSSYDQPTRIACKTIALMLFGGVINICGVLLVAVPFDNYSMSQDLIKIGWSKTTAWIAYLALSFPAIIFWLAILIRWLATKED